MFWILPTVPCVFIAAAFTQYFRQPAFRGPVDLFNDDLSSSDHIALNNRTVNWKGRERKLSRPLAGALVLNVTEGIKVNHENLRPAGVRAKI